MEWWQELLVGGTGATLAISLREALAWRRRRAEVAERRGVEFALDTQSRVLAALQQITDRTRFEQAILLKVTNGGSIPQAGATLYGSVFEESFRPPFRSVKSQWHRQVLDGEYMSLVFDVAQRSRVHLITENMPPGILRDVYMARGVAQSFVYIVLRRPGAMFYLSVASSELFEKLPGESNVIRASVSALANLLRD